MSTKNQTVAIVGAGLVGSLLSIYLANRGYRISVFERRPDMRKHTIDVGRSINLALSNRGIRALEEIGMADAIKKITIPMNGRMMHDIQGRLSFQPYGKQGQFINSVSRGALNEALIDEAEKLGVEFFFDHHVGNVNLGETVINVNVSQQSTINKKFDIIIGADGAFSAVRGVFQLTDRFDYSHDYIDQGYKELHIPASKGAFQLEKNALHIWPRESFMMIALPNIDGSFTCTLFFPFSGPLSFDNLKTDSNIIDFFQKEFPDAVALMPELLSDFQKNPASSLITVKCFPWLRNKTLLIGDAAHAIVPFFGQGMNAGFEDCRIMNQLLDKNNDDWNIVLPQFQDLRKPDAEAIAQLALDNFIEMRDLVADADFLLRKKIEAELHELFPKQWIPLYSMVTFYDQIRYSDAMSIGQKQKKIMDEVMVIPAIESCWQNLDFENIVAKLSR
ncbi:MAG: FAD-dependent monooxygenase [Bacteroidia bacterium]|nr:FAD-dependent monooxygenase [Bacteroidia bacterium]